MVNLSDDAVIGSTASADKNALETGTLGWSGLDNKADFNVEHSGAGISMSPSMQGNMLSSLAMTMPSALMSLGSNGSASSTTYAAVSEGSLLIRDTANQQQDVTTLSHDVEHANNALSPIFNKEKEQQRLRQAQLIGEIGGQVMDIVRTDSEQRALKAAEDSGKAGPRPVEGANDKDTDKQWAKYKADLMETQSYKDVMKQYGVGSSFQQAAQAATAAIQALAGGDIKQAIAGGAAPYLAQLVKDVTLPVGREPTAEERAANLMGHAVVGAVVAQLSGKDAGAGALGAASGELAAEVIRQTVFDGRKVSDLSESEKQSLSALSTLAAGLASGLASGNTADGASGAQAGRNAVENNALSDIMENKVSGVSQAEKYEKAQQQLETMVEEFKQQHCAGLNADACAAKISAHREELLKGALSFGMDFVPVVGDIKSVAEAQTYIDYLAAMAGIIPVAGDAAAKAIKAAEAALKKGDVAEASRLINKASDEISAYSPISYPKLKDDLRQQNLDNIAKQDPRLEIAIKGDGTGKVDFGMGAGSREEADRLGMIWLGDGAKKTSGGGWISADGTRGYRPPSPKDSPFATTGTQANFETYTISSSGKPVKVGNGHLNISD